MTNGFAAYLLPPPASTGHLCRRPGLSRPSPTSTRSPPRTASLYFVPDSLHHHAKLHGAPTPHTSHHPTANKINNWKTTVMTIHTALYHNASICNIQINTNGFQPTSSAFDCASSSSSFCGSSGSIVSLSSANFLCPDGGAAKEPGPDISCPVAVNIVSSVAGSVQLLRYWKGTLP